MGGKGGGNTTSTVTQQDIPKEFFPYFDRLLYQAENESATPYQTYGGQRLAGPSGDTMASYDITRDVAARGSPGLGLASDVSVENISRSGQLMGQAQPYQFSQYGGFQAGQAQPFAGFKAGQAQPFAGFKETQAKPFSDFSASNFKEFGYGPAGQFTGSAASQYMDPYMQNVVDIEKRRAQEDYDIARTGRNARAVQAGAFGGSRAAVQEGLAERSLLEQKGDIQARGLSTAYGDAQRMFEQDRAARMAAEQARAAEAARVQTGVAGEAARVQESRAAEAARVQAMARDEASRVQQAQAAELARTQGIGIDEAARVQQAQAAELARTQGIGLDEAARVQAAQAGETARVQAAQAAESRAAMQDQLAMMGFSAEQASLVADLEAQARTGDIQAAQLLETIGKQQEARQQAGLDIGYEDFLRQVDYDQQQLGFLSSILQGLPIEDAGTVTQQTPYNPVQQALGAGLAGLSLYQGFQ